IPKQTMFGMNLCWKGIDNECGSRGSRRWRGKGHLQALRPLRQPNRGVWIDGDTVRELFRAILKRHVTRESDRRCALGDLRAAELRDQEIDLGEVVLSAREAGRIDHLEEHALAELVGTSASPVAGHGQ